jgi:flagellar FliJ protein
VRSLRERRTDAARQELAQAIAARDAVRGRVYDADAALERARIDHRRSRAAVSAIDATQMHAQQAYAERLEAQRDALRRELAAEEAAVAERKETLARAARSQRTLERLKERRRAEHQREADRREGTMLDEIALERFRRSVA